MRTGDRSSVTDEGSKTVVVFYHGTQNVSPHKTRHYLKIHVTLSKLPFSENEQLLNCLLLQPKRAGKIKVVITQH